MDIFTAECSETPSATLKAPCAHCDFRRGRQKPVGRSPHSSFPIIVTSISTRIALLLASLIELDYRLSGSRLAYYSTFSALSVRVEQMHGIAREPMERCLMRQETVCANAAIFAECGNLFAGSRVRFTDMVAYGILPATKGRA